jgi:RNA polymerase sigma-70 factor, ECF subfamily
LRRLGDLHDARAKEDRMSVADFDTAVADMTARLRGFLRRRVRDDATADDLTQETLLKVYRSRTALRDGQRLEAWLYRIARTTLIDHYRRQRPGQELPADLATEPDGGADDVTKVMARSLRQFVEQLPEAYREPVRLAEFEGLPLTKIAQRFGLSVTAVKSRVRRGRAMLKKQLQQCCRLEFDRMGKIIDYQRRNTARCCR